MTTQEIGYKVKVKPIGGYPSIQPPMIFSSEESAQKYAYSWMEDGFFADVYKVEVSE